MLKQIINLFLKDRELPQTTRSKIDARLNRRVKNLHSKGKIDDTYVSSFIKPSLTNKKDLYVAPIAIVSGKLYLMLVYEKVLEGITHAKDEYLFQGIQIKKSAFLEGEILKSDLDIQKAVNNLLDEHIEKVTKEIERLQECKEKLSNLRIE